MGLAKSHYPRLSRKPNAVLAGQSADGLNALLRRQTSLHLVQAPLNAIGYFSDRKAPSCFTTGAFPVAASQLDCVAPRSGRLPPATAFPPRKHDAIQVACRVHFCRVRQKRAPHPANCSCSIPMSLMHDPTSLYRFEEHDIFLPICTLEELDNNKKGTLKSATRVRRRMIDGFGRRIREAASKRASC